MSELAFNLNGNPFEVPATATRWRFKKKKPNGPREWCSVLMAPPLTPSIDAGMTSCATSTVGRALPVRPWSTTSGSLRVRLHASGRACRQARVAHKAAERLTVIDAMRMNAELARVQPAIRCSSI